MPPPWYYVPPISFCARNSLLHASSFRRFFDICRWSRHRLNLVKPPIVLRNDAPSYLGLHFVSKYGLLFSINPRNQSTFYRSISARSEPYAYPVRNYATCQSSSMHGAGFKVDIELIGKKKTGGRYMYTYRDNQTKSTPSRHKTNS